ncbi:MAG TPA: hypothetical protein VJ873_13680, partial [bacterium]|nr:hypothetical protein [bacterium]
MNTTLVFFLGRKILALGGQGGAPAIDGARIQSSAFMAALLFGLHPLEVETVAWVTCRKDLLCTFFFFASLLVYLDYAAKSQPKLWKLVSSLVCYGLALLCKPMAVTLPLVLILLDGWPLKRWKHGFLRPVLEKTPFFFLALLSGIMTIKAEYGVNAVASLNVVPLGFRVMNAFHSLAFYLAKIIGPFGLCTLYPVHLKRMFSPGYVISVLIVLAAASAVYRNRQKHPHLVTMGLYYLLTISPTLGLVVVGGQMMADRYAYLPSFSVFLALGWWCTGIFNKRFWTSLAVAGVLATLLGFGTVRQLSTWHDSISLWENVLRCDIHNSSAAFDN